MTAAAVECAASAVRCRIMMMMRPDTSSAFARQLGSILDATALCCPIGDSPRIE